jgi:hypothetical protein
VIEHVRPPRNLQSWQQFPVSAIANFRPVVVRDLGRAALQQILKSHPYQGFKPSAHASNRPHPFAGRPVKSAVAGEPPLTKCPLCKKPVRKVISLFNTPTKLKPLSISDAKKAGFTVLKRLGKGEYERQ